VPASRTLPIPAEHREFTVKVAGAQVSREHQLLSVSVSKTANRIAWARLCYLDGSASASDFPLSNADLFVPGQVVEILAGAGSAVQSLFKGVVVRHALRVRDHSAPQLVVECRHAATKLTVERRSATYFDETDSEIIEDLLSAARLLGDVEPTKLKHPQMVQFHTTDWDFLLARARANGKLVLPKADKLVVKGIALSGSPVCELQFGATLLELDAEIDARLQFPEIVGRTWDPAQQTIVEVQGASPSFKAPGNLASSALAAVAGADARNLHHVALDEPEAQAWADAAGQYARLNQVSGRCKCEGIGTINPGDVVTLAGVGKRFNGNVLVTGVRHEFDTVAGWKTHVQFGGVEDPNEDNTAPAAGLVAGARGLQIGVVVSNEDPDREHRVRIRLPMIDEEDDGIWMRVACLDAGADRGFFIRPEIGDEVVVGFLEDDPRRGVVLGMLHSSAKTAPLQGSDDNHEKLFKTRSGMKLYFHDGKKIARLETPAGNSITLTEADKSIVLADQNGNTITMSPDGVQIESAKAFTMKAGTEAKLESGTSFAAKGGTEIKLEGGTTAELSGGATTKVVGGMVQIN
jgi:Rhs element Vgr protein